MRTNGTHPISTTPAVGRRAARIALLALAAAPLLGGCQFALLDPKGPVGLQERSIILLATGLMLLVVVPVIAMTLAFAWRYRAGNAAATYAPDWAHSSRIEAVVWLVPCAIIAVLGIVTWTSTHRLDPYRPLDDPHGAIEVQVVALDWKWLFIYPQYGVASVNELAVPVGRAVNFRVTSGSVMNSFFIPQLGSQIYAMSGMETRLSLVASEAGDYAGLSANYSGGGFSDMRFTARALPASAFEHWVETARNSPRQLTPAAYRALAAPSERAAVAYYGTVQTVVYHDALNQCADGSLCMDTAMRMAEVRSAIRGRMPMCHATDGASWLQTRAAITPAQNGSIRGM